MPSWAKESAVGAVGSDDLGGGEEDEDGQRDHDDGDGLELTPEERLGTFLHRLGDLLHLRRALIGRQDVAGQQQAGGDADDAGGQADIQPQLVCSAKDEGLVATLRAVAARRLIMPGVPFLLSVRVR